MSDIIVRIHRETRTATLKNDILGNDSENLQGNIVFQFVDSYVEGQARLEYRNGVEKKYIILLKKDEEYYCPITAAITKNGKTDMQLVISQGTEEENVPVFKSNVFSVICNASINAEIEKPAELDEWMDVANSKLNQMDNLDINSTQTLSGTMIEITDKLGNTSSTEVQNGKDGVDGKDGKTPVKGVDYFTQSDINQIVNEVLNKIPTSEGVGY